ncbi:endothelin-converting protein [Clostridium neonatale]|uniref:Endothelin-converting protein n=1 Tax=Clostridium neonatale TaxID=137838 RepID=A0A2A7MLI5_9CLOT|nr:M13 family metallopeptidase [Clostridium neonatale]PEG28407.1 endothelin-converting protein [Clostridium neonatale]PEG32554.1 endothelin-converting protein [Clostridium neonatale]
MIKIKRIKALACALAVSLTLLPSVSVKAADVKTSNSQSKIVQDNVRLQDDFYDAVNKSWINSAKIENGKVSNSAFDEADKALDGQKKEIITELLANEKNYASNSDEKKIINLYKNYLNTAARNKQGIEPIKKIIKAVNEVKSIDDLTKLNEDDIANPLINVGCDVDLKDATRYAAYINSSTLSLGDSDKYTKPTEYSKRVKGLVNDYYIKMLKLSGYSEADSKIKVDNLFKLENMIAPYITGQEEASKDSDIIEHEYNVYKLDKLDELAPKVKIKDIMKDAKLDNANTIILSDPKWLKALNDIYKEENLQLIKDYIEINNIAGIAGCLGEDFQKAQEEFSKQYLGTSGDISKEEKAVNAVNSLLAEPFGEIYIQKYFSDKTKENVEEITKEIIKTYEKRIDKLDWMSNETKTKAKEKLDKLGVQIGYPDKWEDYSKLEIRSFEEGGSLLENVINIAEFEENKQIEKINKTVDKNEFLCPPQTINAFYNPTTNTITVPAGILQKPFYDESGNKEKILGGIGAVIGHEISHAFDNTGSQFDGDGNFNNWWTDEDYKKFEEKTNKVREFYNNVKLGNGENVNGSLTVGENISDIGGMACVLDILKDTQSVDYKAFFETNANIWREICTKEYEELKLQSDVHSPNKVRVNAVLPQFDEFYNTYGVKEGDKMYVKPEERLQIW